MAFHDQYLKKVLVTFSGYNNRLKKNRSEREELSNTFRSSCGNVDSDHQEQLKENQQLQQRLKAFIGIATAHAGRCIKAEGPIPLNSGHLSKLAVQINNRSTRDPFAASLYTEATGQLLYAQQYVNEIQKSYDRERTELEIDFNKKIEKINKERSNLLREIDSYFNSQEMKEMLMELKSIRLKFASENNTYSRNTKEDNGICIGTVRTPIAVPEGFLRRFAEITGGDFDISDSTLSLPVELDLENGKTVVIDYDNEKEQGVLSGVQKLILNIARYHGGEFGKICFFDPIRYNNSSLGPLADLSEGSNPFIDRVPASEEEMVKKLKEIVSHINDKSPKRLMVFHNFPHCYDPKMISQIQQLCVNAPYYGDFIVITHNNSSKNMLTSDALSYIKTMAVNIDCSNGNGDFIWYKAPGKLPEDIREKYINKRPVIDRNNDYSKRVGFQVSLEHRKGIRQITDIPYAIDGDGNILKLDFENSNFATFVCGAARSGKSTLLHTLITGIIENKHPDDVEIWLIDFKMTEFSRYINHLPPHVRYIILDESPELVYDIIDRLTEILTKRQNIFKGKWQKLDEVPEEKYMPEIFVIIDEFSVMSQIIADSLNAGKDNYSIKLQLLLAKGAALGLRFIFASQGFTSGTRGLNDFSKKQIQQRIAMKTEFNEIKETLDLKSASDEDRAMMEQLPVHHALTRIPVDAMGNHLKLSEVLYIPDYSKQEELIDRISAHYYKAAKYDVGNEKAYIDKRSMIIDGNSYTAFESKRNEMEKYISSNLGTFFDEDEAVLFLGEPRRMMPIYPIEITNSFCENLLLIAPNNETMATASLLRSVHKTLQLQQKDIEIWSSAKNSILRQLTHGTEMRKKLTAKGLEQVCSEIRGVKKSIENKSQGNRFIVLLGLESLIMDMSYQEGMKEVAAPVYEKRKEGEMDLNTMLDMLMNNKAGGSMTNNEITMENTVKAMVYDGREDLKFIFTHGPSLGYHFLIVFNTVGEFLKSRIDISLFKHKIMFRIPKADAMNIVGSSGSGVVSELSEHSFRYSNGLDSLSLRPYLHRGLSWDGWEVSDNGVIHSVQEEEEYLL